MFLPINAFIILFFCDIKNDILKKKEHINKKKKKLNHKPKKVMNF
jgi:hypothetical protein